MDGFVKVARTAEVPPGSVVAVKGIALYNVDGKYYATANKCLHMGGPLGKGVLQGSVITCPTHAWEYDVTTGRCLTVDQVFLERFEVRVDGDDLLVATTGKR